VVARSTPERSVMVPRSAVTSCVTQRFTAAFERTRTRPPLHLEQPYDEGGHHQGSATVTIAAGCGCPIRTSAARWGGGAAAWASAGRRTGPHPWRALPAAPVQHSGVK